MQLRKDKCLFGYQELEFAGHIISPDGHRPAASLAQIIAEHKTPSSKTHFFLFQLTQQCSKELQRFRARSLGYSGSDTQMA